MNEPFKALADETVKTFEAERKVVSLGSKAALSAQDWRDFLRYTNPATENLNAAHGMLAMAVSARDYRGVAAMALRLAGSPMFTWDDADDEVVMAQASDAVVFRKDVPVSAEARTAAAVMGARHRKRAAIIMSLLPPKAP